MNEDKKLEGENRISYKRSKLMPTGECLENIEIEVSGRNLNEVRKHFDEIKEGD